MDNQLSFPFLYFLSPFHGTYVVPSIPLRYQTCYVGILLSDLTFVEENPDYVEKGISKKEGADQAMINFEKNLLITQIITSGVVVHQVCIALIIKNSSFLLLFFLISGINCLSSIISSLSICSSCKYRNNIIT